MKIKKLSKIKALIMVGLVSSLSLLAMSGTASAKGNIEGEFKSVIQNYNIEDVYIENGITLKKDEVLDISSYSNWSLSNDETVKITDGILIPISEGTVFLSHEIDGKLYVIEIYVDNNIKNTIESQPTNLNRDYYKVFIDPGHGGSDPGAVANGYRESDINLQVAKKVESKLKSKGIQVKMSRSTDVFYSLNERANMSNSYGADAFISIHQNSFTNPSANGIETYYRPDVSKYKVMSDKIQSNIIKETKANSRGVKTNKYTVLMNTKMISALVECGFITNPTESKNISNPTYQDKLATGIANGIESYLKEYVKLDTTSKFDDINNHWAKEAIVDFISKGHINGYEDNTFRPNNSITRAEFVKIVNRVFGFNNTSSVGFSDVSKNHWAYNEISIAINAGYIDGYPGNIFKPDEFITREAAAKMLCTIMNLEGDGELSFNDSNLISEWAKPYVDALSDNGILVGSTGNNFNPKYNMTRAEVVVMLSRVN